MDHVLNSPRQPTRTRRRVNRRIGAGRGFLSLWGACAEGVAYLDGQGVFVFVNPATEAIFGSPPGGLAGRSLRELLFQGRRASDGDLDGFDLIRESGTHDLQIRRDDGSCRHLLLSISPDLAPEGGPRGFFGIFRDITDWKRAELDSGRLSIAIEQAFDSIIIADIRGRILYANPATRDLTGYGPETLLGSHIAFLGSARHDRVFYRDLWRQLLGGEAWRGRIQHQRMDGGVCEVLSTFSPVRGVDGSIQYVVIDSRDMTRELELEAQLRHSQRMEAIGVLAGGIAHDFNNLLTPILGYTEMALMRAPQDSRMADHLQEIMTAGQRAADLVEQILAFSRQGEQPRKPVLLGPVVKETLKLLRAAIPKSIPIRAELRALDRSVLADPGQLHQVVMNLCTNAYQAMKEKGGRLEVKLDLEILVEPWSCYGMVLGAGNYLCLRVSDSGTGMDPETLKKAFLPFFTTRPTGEGTGLGLSIVHGIVMALGGGIQVTSEPGLGSTFAIYLPAMDACLLEPLPPRPMPGPGQGRILVVDDEPSVGELMREILEALGYQVSVLGSSLQAQEALVHGGESFDLIISDMTMPDLTGLELLKRIRTAGVAAPVVLMTGFSQDLEELAGLEGGPSALLRKPVDIRALAELLAGLLAVPPR